jgi:hypothetical protein
MSKQPRTFSRNGHTVELIGPAKRVGVWIDGKRHVNNDFFWSSLRAARLSAFDYCARHPK